MSVLSIKITHGPPAGLNLPGKSLSLCQQMIGSVLNSNNKLKSSLKAHFQIRGQELAPNESVR